MREKPKKVLFADLYPIVRAGFMQIANDNADEIVADEASDYQEAVAKATTNDYDAIVLGVTTCNGCAVNTLRQIAAVKPDLPILVFGTIPEGEYAIRTLKAGAAGYGIQCA